MAIDIEIIKRLEKEIVRGVEKGAMLSKKPAVVGIGILRNAGISSIRRAR